MVCQDTFEQIWKQSFYVKNTQIKGPEIIADSKGNVLVISVQTLFNTQTGFVLVKYDTLGNELWDHHYDGNFPHIFTAFSMDNQNNAYVAIDYGLGLPGSEYDAILLKYAPDGELLWELNYGENIAIDNYVGRMVTDSSGNLYLYGSTFDANDANGHFFFVSCIDQMDGHEKWRTDQPGYIYPQNMKIVQGKLQTFATEYTPIGRNYIIQQFDLATGDLLHSAVKTDAGVYQPDFNYISKDGHTLIGNRGFLYSVSKVNLDGDTLWQYNLPNLFGNPQNWVRSIVEDDSSNVYITGGATQPGTWLDLVTSKLSSSGDLLWQNFYFGVVDSLGDTGEDILVDSQFVYVSGGKGTGIDTSDVVNLIYDRFTGNLLFELIDSFDIFNYGENLSFIENGFAYCGRSRSNETNTVKLVTGYYKFSHPVPTKEPIEKTAPFLLYPNPASNIVYVQQSKRASVKNEAVVFDINGRLLLTKPFLNADKIKLDVGHLPSGMYVIKVGDQVLKFNVTK